MRFALFLIFLATLAAQESTPVDALQRAVDLDPNNVTARLYLATALMSQYIPGAQSPENLELARQAEAEFRRVLDAQPNNTTALASLASLTFQQAKLADSASWYEKLIAADPQNKEAYYSLGVIDWQKWYPAWMRARSDLGMRPEQPGPLTDTAVRQRLKQQYSATIEHGISNLENALHLDPQYEDAMTYMNLLIRERADLADSPEQYRREIKEADEWVQKALDTKKAKAAAQGIIVPYPEPLPGMVQRIRVGQNVQAANLIHKVDPVCPADARVQGTVRLKVITDRDGHVQQIQLISGHPLLVGAAMDAVKQWQYRPTLLNGVPVEVETTVDVEFRLP